MLDEKRLIWLGGKGIGNTQNTEIRRGVAIMGAFRMTELHQIDPARIYACGDSGGARAASAFGFLRPDFFKGIVSNVGGMFPDDLPNKFQTDDTEGDAAVYEFISLTADPAGLSAIRHQPATRFAMLDYYTDYREDDIHNIFHLGMLNHGNRARMLIRPGAHGGIETGSFRDAIQYLEHPRQTVVADDFGDGDPLTTPAGAGWTATHAGNGTAAETHTTVDGTALTTLELRPSGGTATLESPAQAIWHDPYGFIIDTRLRVLDHALGGQTGTVAVHSVTDGALLRVEITKPSAATKTGRFVLRVAGGAETEICRFDFAPADEPIIRAGSDPSFYGPEAFTGAMQRHRGTALRIEVWNDSFLLTFGQDITAASFTSTTAPTPAKLIDDRRSITGRWSELGLTPAIAEFGGKRCSLRLSAAGEDGISFDSLSWLAPTGPLPAAAPVAAAGPDLTATDSDLSANEPVTLNGSGSSDADGTIVAYDWAWNGGSASGVSPIATFPVGITTVTLTVTDNDGATATATVRVTVDVPGGINLFTDTGPTAGNICDPANWSQGVPPTSAQGVINRDATWWPGENSASPGTGATTAAANILTGYQLKITGGTLGRGANFIPELRDCTIDLQGGHLSNNGPGTRVLRLSGSSVVTVGAGSTFTGDPDNNKLEFKAGGTGMAQVKIKGGSLAFAAGITTEDNATPHAVLVFGPGAGTATTGAFTFISGGGYIDFQTGSPGTLTVTGATRAYFEALWDTQRLRVAGANMGSFSQAFTVNGATLSINPTPADPWIAWQQDHFTPEQIAAGSAAENADPDGDTRANLMEYALGSDPTERDPALVPTLEDGKLGITFTRTGTPAGVTLTAETSENLGFWEPATIRVLSTAGATTTLRAETPQGTTSLRFIRLLATHS